MLIIEFSQGKVKKIEKVFISWNTNYAKGRIDQNENSENTSDRIFV